MWACKPQIITVPIETKTEIRERLVEVAMPADSALLSAYFECDSNFNVLLRRFDEHKTANIQSNIEYDTNTGKLLYQIVRQIDTVYITVTDTTRYKEIAVPIYIPQKEPRQVAKILLLMILFFGMLFIGFAMFKLFKI
jgi:hypothetical protein